MGGNWSSLQPVDFVNINPFYSEGGGRVGGGAFRGSITGGGGPTASQGLAGLSFSQMKIALKSAHIAKKALQL